MATASELRRAQQWTDPRPEPRPRQAPRRRLKRWVPTALVLAAVFAMAVATALSGAMMARMGFQVDQLQSQLTSAQRARQALQDQVVSLTSAPHLAYEAQHLGVPLAPLVLTRPAAPAARPAARAAAHPRAGLWSRVAGTISTWLSKIRGVQAGRSPAAARSVHRART